eukprot:scaffold17996_cov55-Cyclotella_meneghiniana.AAC.2
MKLISIAASLASTFAPSVASLSGISLVAFSSIHGVSARLVASSDIRESIKKSISSFTKVERLHTFYPYVDGEDPEILKEMSMKQILLLLKLLVFSAMPTFQWFKSGEKVDEYIGASEDELKSKPSKQYKMAARSEVLSCAFLAQEEKKILVN